ncbi:hypothetical protein U879_09435 [Defluviimonas sp. 20V17]|uniref:Flagellar protein FliL n=1 Tax=Allgaiera indica TaxID=765699 RepID=A0AAN4UNN2_9RHOB|nr:flagellar basal body-associated FliL family protein [Allgaiera indica]KDB03941.1 hypothetical protein U879_09435 [Defluviimonas sp. 20V17]GHD99278.1 hypothetical protein GCM10008024_06020 [Allgaiera indica]SDW29952.1 flagellar FliL protein [Allgaiera indica]
MVDAAANEDQEPQGRDGFLGRRRGLILLALGLSVVALAGGAWLGLAGRDAAATDQAGRPGAKVAADAGHGGAGAAAADEAVSGTLDFKDIVVNVSGSSASGQPTERLMKIRFDMTYADPKKNNSLMEKKKPYLREAILSYLRQLHEADLRGSDGLFLLKAELLKRARAVVGNDAPQEFLIVDLVMQ